MTCAMETLAQRTILDLTYMQDWSVPAIAAHLHCSVSTVKTRRCQARRCLIARLLNAERSLTHMEREGHDPHADATPVAM